MEAIKAYYNDNKKFCIVLGLLMLLTAVMLLSFNYKGHDYSFHIQRMASITEEIKAKGLGAFPIRIYSTNMSGYGYANPMFYGDIFLYPFAILILLGLNAVYAYRIMAVCVYIFCFCSSYYCVKQIVRDTESAIVGAMLYTFSAYFAVDIFIRNSLGEFFAYAFLPFLSYGFYCTMINRDMPKKHRLFLVLGMSGVILSHIISTVMVTVTLVIMFAVFFKKWIKEPVIIKDFIYMALITAGVCAFFVFPLLEQMICSKFYVTTEDRFYLADGKMHIASWIAPHGFWKLQMERFPEAAMASWFPGGFGFVLTALLLIWVVNIKKLNKKTPVIMLIISLLLVEFAHGWILPLEKLQGLLGFMQFPFRVLLLSTLFMSIFGVYAVYKLKSKKINWLLLVMCIISCMIVMFSSYQIIRKEVPNMDGEYTLTTNSVGNAEYIPEEMLNSVEDKDFGKYTFERGDSIEVNHRAIRITNNTNDRHGNVEFNFSNNTYSDTTFEMPLIYYKGYSAKDTETGENYKVSVSENGLVNVNVGETENGSVRVRYTGTLTQHISDIVSFISIMLLIMYVIKPKWLALIKEKLLFISKN